MYVVSLLIKSPNWFLIFADCLIDVILLNPFNEWQAVCIKSLIDSNRIYDERSGAADC